MILRGAMRKETFLMEKWKPEISYSYLKIKENDGLIKAYAFCFPSFQIQSN